MSGRTNRTMYPLLAILNLLMPKEWSSRRVARAIPYGSHARQVLDIYAPKAAGPWPVIYFLYGGSWNLGDRRYYEFAGRALAAAGFVVVIADYRLLPEVEYPVFLDDCALGFAWTLQHIAEYGGDPSRAVLMGHSAGAYNAMLILLDPDLLPRMGFAAKVHAVVGLSGPYDFYPFDVPISLRTFGGVGDPKSTQPVNLVRSGLPPVFLGTGDRDRLVYPRNSIALAGKLRAAGGDVTERHYPGLGHAGTLLTLGAYNRYRAPVLAEVVAFLRKHTAG